MDYQLENIEQLLIEHIADFLDDSYTNTVEAIGGFKDPIHRGDTELHVRMAKAAMIEYKNTIKPT